MWAFQLWTVQVYVRKSVSTKVEDEKRGEDLLTDYQIQFLVESHRAGIEWADVLQSAWLIYHNPKCLTLVSYLQVSPE